MNQAQTPVGIYLPHISPEQVQLRVKEGIIAETQDSIHSSGGKLDPLAPPPAAELAAPSNERKNPRDTVLQAFCPRVLILASADTQELVRLKGISGGLAGLLQPFEEHISGNIVTRDSSGASKTLPDFGVRFIAFPDDLLTPSRDSGLSNVATTIARIHDGGSKAIADPVATISTTQYHIPLDEVLYSFLSKHEKFSSISYQDAENKKHAFQDYNDLYLRKLLAERLVVPYEAATHPVACLVAISSQSAAPIDTLRDLYNETRHGSKFVPTWMSDEFLRYYLLIHDEDEDDIAKTTLLFDQMKKHFGLHCHLLRLRSAEASASAEDTLKVPQHRWLPASAEVENIRRDVLQGSNPDVDGFEQYLFETDVTVIKGFIREMVTQSIIPFIESRIAAWNDQVASKRRGLSGRFMSFSKRWTTFGPGRGSKSSSAASASSNYDTNSGIYPPRSSEATMHRLAGYAFLLRDWALSGNIYDLLRADFSDDKAWTHAASAHEMAALAQLLDGKNITSRAAIESIDQMVDSACYSYQARCSDPNSAIRCLVLAVELYGTQKGTGIAESAKWANRLLELSILSPISQCIVSEELARILQSHSGIGSRQWGSQHRKAALWQFLATSMWLELGMESIAAERLRDAKSLYAGSKNSDETPPFHAMVDLWEGVHHRLSVSAPDKEFMVGQSRECGLDEEQEELTEHDTGPVTMRRRSTGFGTGMDKSSIFQSLQSNTRGIDDGFS